MSAAAFVLAINLMVASIFAIAFGVVAAYQRSALGARWLAGAYALGAVNPLFEFVAPYQQDARLVSFAIFATFLVALAAFAIGLARHYRVDPPWLLLGASTLAAMALNIAILDMPHDDMLRGILYQAPYTLMQAIAVLIALRNPRRHALDYALIALLAVSALQFLVKPLLAILIGDNNSAQGYISSNYAAFSQTMGALLLIATGLLVLLIISRDMLADMTTRSETDALSKLLNRRGFEERGESALAAVGRAGVPAVMIVADLDHFKSINDTLGHAAGDRVIEAFAQVLQDAADQRTVIGRLGGEEFAALLPGANLGAGRLYAETARVALCSLDFANLGLSREVTASFGVAPMRDGDTLSELLRRADAALYQAKTEGRNRVCVLVGEPLRPAGTMRSISA